jgi:hypothetical protein
MRVTRVLTAGLLCLLLPAPHAFPAEPRLNPKLLELEPNRWHKLHEQQPGLPAPASAKAGDPVRFQRQEHGGSCFDSRRGHLILFGSNSHGRDWTNSPLLFDPATCKWTRLYPDDPKETYAVNNDGLPVAGQKADHPWAMHTFGTVVYDPERDEMIVCCYDAHMVPGRFTDALKDVWGKVKRHPTWTFDLAKHEWRPLPCEAQHFFPYTATYDSDRKVIVGYRPDGIYELAGEPREWKKVAPKGFFGWHTNAAYDSRNKAVVVFGSNENSNDVVVLRPATGEHRKMPTPGQRPPKDQHSPMCFDPQSGRVVVVVDHKLEEGPPPKAQAETWLYGLAADAWTQLPDATLPFPCGMNYNMAYDPNHRVCLLVTGGYGQPTAVWALRVDVAKMQGR